MNAEASDLWERSGQADETARRIAGSDPDAAASRAYYAAFYAVSAHFSLRGTSFSKHAALEIAVHRDLVKTDGWPESVGCDFSFLRELRTTGDYGGAMHVTAEEARYAVAAAGRILHEVRSRSGILGSE